MLVGKAETMEGCFPEVQLVTIGLGPDKESDCQCLCCRNVVTDWR